MRISIVTLATPGIMSYAHMPIAKNKAYAEKHGYGFENYSEILDPSRPASWSKLIALKNHFKDNDWLIWIDADAMIMNPEIKLESLIYDQFDFICARDANGPNCGIFLVKCSDYMSDMFDKIYKKIVFINHIWWEQAAIMDELTRDQEFQKKTTFIAKNRINSYLSDYKKGDFILHLPGMSNEMRTTIFQNLVASEAK